MLLNINDPTFRTNPYPYFKECRRHAPLCRIKPHDCWAVFKFLDVEWVLKEDGLFSSVLSDHPFDEGDPQFLLYARSLVGMDNPTHNRLRKRLSHTFLPGIVRQLEPAIEAICHRLTASIPRQQPVDFAQIYSKPMPILVLLHLLGIEGNRVEEMKGWIEWLLSWRNHPQPDLMMRDIQQMHAFFNQVIIEKRQSPGDDLISALLSDNFDLEPLTSAELLALIRLLLTAGTDTASSLLNHSLLALASHPKLIEQIRSDKRLIHNVIEETLRYNSPTISLIRKATKDIPIGEKLIKKGDIVLPFVASANHDETVFINPEAFDIHRQENPHLGFGTGIHHCLGYHLGKLQVRQALSVIVDRFSNFKIMEDKPMQYLPTIIFRSLRSLPMLFS